jgi:hypothetical protein
MKTDSDTELHPKFQPQALISTISPLAWDPNAGARPSLTGYVILTRAQKGAPPVLAPGRSASPLHLSDLSRGLM